ncbi:hypothetical protein Ga0074812_14852 [Parafrankia irregularis]|uniref:Uncharacterized protein n=1 Tax=Parafrankia irregularis TaxID=795642 RepID=A0A0S4R014_9ACTN|nr:MULTISPECIES: hypothetical protein [Parafrankia]MBE3206776.1 hypothetical protein [Parafrankia sp. CH37]CUU60852.1 hypothetical protein Ga0074812_14852 [Parafrankia irregularis]
MADTDPTTTAAVMFSRHVKAALMHLRAAATAAAAAGVDIDGPGEAGNLARVAGDAVEDLDLWAIRHADTAGVRRLAYAGTEHWCAIPGGTLPHPDTTAGSERLWTRDDVLAYLDSVGAPVGADTWSGYVSRDQAPAPARRIGRTPVWDPAAVRAWHTGRRGRGWRADQPTGTRADNDGAG